MDLVADVSVVDLSHAVHDIVGEWRHVGCGDVIFDLRRVLAAWDGAGDGGVHEDPT
jgi:hypothetical protein